MTTLPLSVIPEPPSTGAVSSNSNNCASVPFILFEPQSNQLYPNLDSVAGFAAPNATIDFTLGDLQFATTSNGDGFFCVNFPQTLTTGYYSLTATMQYGCCCKQVTVDFVVAGIVPQPVSPSLVTTGGCS